MLGEDTEIVEIECSLNTVEGQFDWQSLFGNTNPLEIEIGIGKGRFLIESALDNPQRNYLGIEWAKKYVRITKQRLEKRSITNVRVLHADARYVFDKHIPCRTISAIRVFFPDPWPKKRHHKRRIFQDETCTAMERALKDKGFIEIRTDYGDYYEQIVERFTKNTQLKMLNQSEIALLEIDQSVRTNYEVKYRKEGRSIFTAIYQAQLDGRV